MLKNKVLTDAEEFAIKYLHQKDHSNRDIGKILGLHHTTVGKYLKSWGLDSNYLKKSFRQPVNAKNICCTKCNTVKPSKEFNRGRKGTDKEYVFSYCKDCRNKQIIANLNSDPRKFIKDRFNRLLLRSKKDNIKCTITFEELLLRYYSQKEKCFFTDEPFSFVAGQKLQRNSLSIDKIIPEKGYVKGNVVFTTHRINTCKNDLSLSEIEKWMPIWYNKIQDFINK